MACWLVEHPKTVAGAGIVVSLGMAAGVFRWGMNYMGQADQLPPGLEWLGWARNWGGWIIGAVNVAWLLYAHRRCNGEAMPATVHRPERPTLSSMMYGRIYERQPVRKDRLPLFGWIGAVGLVCGMSLTLWLALATSGGQMQAWRWALIFLAGLALLTLHNSVLTLRDTLILANDDHFIADREDQVAAELEGKQRQREEADREYDRKTVRGWPIAILYGGFFVGGMLLLKFQDGPIGIAAFQSSVAWLVATAVWIYTGRLCPQGWRAGRTLTVAGAAGFLAYTVQIYGFLWLPMLLGLAWGGVTGGVGTFLYLRKLRRS